VSEIRTTHVGSLPRSAAVTEVLFAAERGDVVEPASFDAIVGAAVENAVARQLAAGIDLVSDGEMAKSATRPTSRTGSPVSTVTRHADRRPTWRTTPASWLGRPAAAELRRTGDHDVSARCDR